MNKKKQVEEKAYFGRVKNTLKMGIVGFPNVGKSSTFNLLANQLAKAENFPFCTIDPNEAQVPIPDERFEKLCEMWQPKSKVPTALKVYDIAGLVAGAHEGEGLGNAFLSNIQAVDGIYHMVRAFKDADIVHYDGEVNPISDLKIISNELVQKDLMSIAKKVDDLEKKITRFNDSQAKKEIEMLQKAQGYLKEGKWIKDCEFTNKEILYLNDYYFFTAKPVVYLINISTKDYQKQKNKWLPKIKQWIDQNCPGKMIPFSVSYEQAIQNGEIKAKSQIDKIVQTGYELLNLIHFFTCGKDEVRCWTVRKGSKAPQAAGVIHTDFEKGFICAEVMKYNDFIELGSESEVKNQGKYMMKGKEYIVEDGDIIFFKFNKPNPSKKK